MSSSRPLLSSSEEAEEYDLLPTSGSSSTPHSHRRRHSGDHTRRPSILPSWIPSLHSKKGACLFFGVTFVVGLLAGNSIPISTIPSGRTQPATSSASALNPFELPGVVINRPLLPPEVNINEPYGWYDRVRWKTVPSLDSIRNGDGRLIDRRQEQDGTELDDQQFQNEFPSLFEELVIAHKRGVIPAGWNDWGVNKTVLGIGDSLMRNNLLFFSKHVADGDVDRKLVNYTDELGKDWHHDHRQGVVDVPVVDLKICNWFHMGMVESAVDGFFNNESIPQNFEQKLEKVFLKSRDDPDALNGRTPDLVIFESLSWDLVLLANLARDAGDLRYEGRPMDDIELGWYRGRLVSVLALIRRTFPTSKLILQTPHLGAKAQIHVFSPIRKFQQAQAIASVALETGVDLFDWGRIVSSLSNELVDGLHFRSGAATWIWGEMVLHYLREAWRKPMGPMTREPTETKDGGERITQQDMIESYQTTKKIVYPLPMVDERRRRALEDVVEEIM